MPKFDLSITISAIIAIAAVVSPILTTLINNHHQARLRKIELKQKHFEETVIYQRKIFENYLRAAGRCAGYNDGKASQDYHESYFLAFMYVPDTFKPQMQEINQYFYRGDLEAANIKLEQLIPNLQAYMKSL